jgi:hypothetical protein
LRILFSSVPTHGHTYPLLPLAAAASAQGHEVTYATNETFHAPLVRLGFDVVNAGLDLQGAFAIAAGSGGIEAARDLPSDQLMAIAGKVFGSVVPKSFVDDLPPIIDRLRPDLVVWEVGNPGAGLAARAAGVPALSHGFGRVPPNELKDFMRQGLDDLAAGLGIALTGNDFFGIGDPVLDICPPTFQDPDFLATADRIPLRPVPFAEPGDLPAWVREHERPLVYLTLGTAFGAIDVLRKAIDGLAVLDVRVLVAVGPSANIAELGDVPDNVTVESWVPQADLLPFTDLVVHHGGSGTTLGSLSAGVPQLILPQGADQFTNAEAVTGLGAGEQLLGAEANGDAIAIRAKHLLGDESVREVSRALAAEIAAMPSPEEVARRLPEFARR